MKTNLVSENDDKVREGEVRRANKQGSGGEGGESGAAGDEKGNNGRVVLV